jgi:hypothetical protein
MRPNPVANWEELAALNATRGLVSKRNVALDRVLLLLGLFAVTASAVFFLLTGVVGKGREGEAYAMHDFLYFYAAGRMWLDGASPYLYADYVRHAVGSIPLPPEQVSAQLTSAWAYPPTSATPLAVLGLTSFDTARLIFCVVNALSLLIIALIFVHAAAYAPNVRHSRWRTGVLALVATLTIGSPFASHNMWMGQSSLFVVAALSATWWLLQRGPGAGRGTALAAAAAALATIKPPLAILYLFQVTMLERRVGLVVAGALFCCLLILPAVVASGPLGALREWLQAMAEYSLTTQAQPDFHHSFGIRSIFASAGLDVPNMAPLALAVMIPAWLGRGFTPLDRFALCLSASLLFIHAHDYSLVAVAPLVAALLIRAAGSAVALATVVGATVVLYLPIRFVLELDMPLLGRWREIVLLAMTAALLWCGWRMTEPARPG